MSTYVQHSRQTVTTTTILWIMYTQKTNITSYLFHVLFDDETQWQWSLPVIVYVVKYKNGRVWTFIWENNWSFGSLVIPLSRYSLQERTIFLYSLKFQVFMEKTTDKISKGWHSDNFSTKTKFWSFLLFKEDIVGMVKLFGSGFRSFWSYWIFFGKQSDCFRMLLGEKETI